MEARELRLGETASTAVFECSLKCVCLQCHFEGFIKAKVGCLTGVKIRRCQGCSMGSEEHDLGLLRMQASCFSPNMKLDAITREKCRPELRH